MRRYYIVTGILLILSIIDFDFALAAPVQGKHQARVDVVHMSKDLTTVLEKRWDEGLEKLGEEYFKMSRKPVESSGTHPSSSSASLGPDHGSADVVEPTAPNQASSTADPSLMESSCSPSTSPVQGLSARGNSWGKSCLGLVGDALTHGGPYPMHGNGPMMFSLYRPPFPVTKAPAPQLKPDKGPPISPSADSNVDQDHSTKAEDPLPSSTLPRPMRPKMHFGEASGHAPSPPGPPLTESVLPSPSPGTGELAESENEVLSGLQLNHPSLSADSQPPDPQSALYEAKGKAVMKSRIFSAPPEMLRVTERSLDHGE